MTKEEILNKHVSLYFSSHHDKSRWNGEGENGGAEWHTDKAIAADIYKAMDEYTQSISLAYDEWKWANRWHSLENGFWYQTLDHPSAMSDKTYNKHHRKTTQELYNQFIEQQTKDK